MAVQAVGVHLPLHRLDGKRARQASIQRGFEALRVPDWDEDPLTMAVEAGLLLPDEALEGVERIRLFAEATQPGLCARALDVDAPVVAQAGQTGLLAEWASGVERDELWLAAGADVGGAGVAFRTGAGEGARPVDAALADGGPIGSDPGDLAAEAIDRLDPSGPVTRLATPGRASRADGTPFGLTVGPAGPAAAGLELSAHWAEGGTAAVLATAQAGQAVAVETDGRPDSISGLDRAWVDLDPEAYRRRERSDPPAWSQASQGAYVSREVYDADPARRYGARARGPGTVVAATTIEGGPPGEFNRQHEASGPYDVVIVDLDREEGREIGQAAAPPGRLSIGDRVRPVLRRVFEMEDEVRYGLKWRPASEG